MQPPKDDLLIGLFGALCFVLGVLTAVGAAYVFVAVADILWRMAAA